MSDTTTRALGLLSLLQTHRHWPGSELAERLGVTERTVRRDIERLRGLGYRIESLPGAAGGYRLEAGNALPPLLLGDDEAVAIAIGLRLAATQRLVDGTDTTLSALAKLEQVLPPQLRARVSALADAMQPIGPGQGAPVSPAVLGELALACRDHARLRFDYVAADGSATRRRAEPHSLAPARRNWYLLAWDLDRGEWRTFRVDRIGEVEHTGLTFEPHDLSSDDAAEIVRLATTAYLRRSETAIVLDLPVDRARAMLGRWDGGVEPLEDDPSRTRWPIAESDPWALIGAIARIPDGVGYELVLPAAHRERVTAALDRARAALGPALA